MNAQLVFYIGKKLAHFVKEFEAYAPEVGELDPETETRDAVIKNPLYPDDPAESLYIEFGEEFTVYWHGHKEFSPEDYWYDMMVEYVHAILDGQYIFAVVSDSAGKVISTLSSRRNPDECTTASVLYGSNLPDNAAFCQIHIWGKAAFEIPIK